MEFRNLKDVNFDEFNDDFTVAFDFTGITRDKAAETLQEYFGNKYLRPYDQEDSRVINDQSGREWKIVFTNKVLLRIRGMSFLEQVKKSTAHEISDIDYCNRLVTPPISQQDIPMLQDIIERIREAGGIVNKSCHTYIEPCAQPSIT